MTFLFPEAFDFEQLKKSNSITIFNGQAINFLNALSKEILKNPQARFYPDIVTFAFFCRKANITKYSSDYEYEKFKRVGRGVVFHITPSNVPVNFAYSMISGLLAGNTNIIRVPSKEFIQVEIIIDAIKELAKNSLFKEVLDKIVLLRYKKESDANKMLSSLCDVRVIWGGDNSIESIRKNQLSPRAFDVTFSDRYSICIINSKKYLNEKNQDKIALGFYNDTYLFDQNACTAPHLVVWYGNNLDNEKAKSIFWANLHKLTIEKYKSIEPIIAIDKLTVLFHSAVRLKGVVKRVQNTDNILWRIEVDKLNKNLNEYKCTSGYFMEYSTNVLSDLSEIITPRFQTISYFGFINKELEKFIIEEGITGIDRIVPIGQTMDFSFFWDGFDLIRTLSRTIYIS